ncbi:hypothetical protein C0992_011287, partial [Termitomyces sp. T32_za158]
MQNMICGTMHFNNFKDILHERDRLKQEHEQHLQQAIKEQQTFEERQRNFQQDLQEQERRFQDERQTLQQAFEDQNHNLAVTLQAEIDRLQAEHQQHIAESTQAREGLENRLGEMEAAQFQELQERETRYCRELNEQLNQERQNLLMQNTTKIHQRLEEQDQNHQQALQSEISRLQAEHQQQLAEATQAREDMENRFCLQHEYSWALWETSLIQYNKSNPQPSPLQPSLLTQQAPISSPPPMFSMRPDSTPRRSFVGTSYASSHAASQTPPREIQDHLSSILDNLAGSVNLLREEMAETRSVFATMNNSPNTSTGFRVTSGLSRRSPYKALSTPRYKDQGRTDMMKIIREAIRIKLAIKHDKDIKTATRNCQHMASPEELFQSHQQICQEGLNKPDHAIWESLLQLVIGLQTEGQSSDESDDTEHDLYHIRSRPWRNAQVTELLKYIDNNRETANNYGNRQAGKAFRTRICLARPPVTQECPIAGLPHNFYDSDFLNTRRQDQLDHLDVQEVIELPKFEK